MSVAPFPLDPVPSTPPARAPGRRHVRGRDSRSVVFRPATAGRPYRAAGVAVTDAETAAGGL